MIWHLAGMIGALAAQAQGAMQIQCVQQAVPESWVKLLPTVVQTVVSLASIAAGVSIAVWSFRKNRQVEHEQWVRDQKKAEWRELLEAVKACERDLALISIPGKAIPDSAKSDAYQRARRVQMLFYDRLFIDDFALIGVLSKWVKISDWINMPDENRLLSAEYTSAFTGLLEELRKSARKDLGVPV